jgi:hypothetical protein
VGGSWGFPQHNIPAAKAANVAVSFQVDKGGKRVEPCAIRVTTERIRLLLGKCPGLLGLSEVDTRPNGSLATANAVRSPAWRPP